MSQPYSGGPADEISAATTAPTNAPTPGADILLVESDLFFLVKVRDTLTHAGYVVRVARRIPDLEHMLGGTDASAEPQSGAPALLLVNAAARGLDWRTALTLARERDIPVIVYAPHVDTATQAAARAEGAARVIANSKLATDLPGIVARTLQPSSSRPGGSPIDTGEGDDAPATPTTTTSHRVDAAIRPTPTDTGDESAHTTEIPAKSAIVADAPAREPTHTQSTPITLPHDGQHDAPEQRGSRREAMDPPAPGTSGPRTPGATNQEGHIPRQPR